MKQIILCLLLFAGLCNAQTVEATASWTAVEGVWKYHIFIWEGADILDNPLVEDSSFEYINSLGLLHLTDSTTQISFQVIPNGEFIQVAGFNEYPDSIILPATLSVVVQKIRYLKMQDLSLEFEGDLWMSFIIDSLSLGINLADGNLPKREDGTYLYWKLNSSGKLTPINKFKLQSTNMLNPEPNMMMAERTTVMDLFIH